MKQTRRPDHGIDLIDLAEFPITALSDAPSTDTPNFLEFRDKDKVWQIAGHPKYGVPTPCDGEVYMALLEHSREHGFLGKIPFRRHQILRLMGWRVDARRYERLTLAFRRWAHTTFTAFRAVHDPQTGAWIDEQAFSFLETYRIRRRPEGEEDEAPWPCWFRWSETVRELLQAGYYHEIDTRAYLGLHSPIAQAEMRYLTARARDGKPEFRQHLLTFAQQHIGLRQPYVSQIQRKLIRPHAELIAGGFLRSVEYEVIKGKERAGEVMVVFRFPARPERAGKPALPEPAPHSLVERLIEAGVTRAVAARLVADHDAQVELQLDYLPERKARNRAAVLVRAIEEEWPAPESWRKARRQQARAGAEQERRAALEATEARSRAEAEAFDAWWAALPPVERERLLTEARREEFGDSPTLIETARRCPDILYQALRPTLMQLTGWQPAPGAKAGGLP